MAKIIQFPEPFEQKFLLAKRAFEEKRYLESKRLLEKLYLEKKEFEVSQLLVQIYIIQGEEVKALELADELEDLYLSSVEGIKQYFHLIVLNNQFIRAHILLNSGKEHQFLIEEKAMLSLFENVYTQTNLALFEEKKQQFLTFKTSHRPINHREWSDWLIGMTKDQCEFLIIPALTENLSVFLLSRCCELLIKIGETRKLTICHPILLTLTDVSFSSIKLLEKSDCLKVLTEKLHEYFDDQPYLFEVLYSEIVGHWAFLFPFLPMTEEVDSWISVYLRDYDSVNVINKINDSMIQKRLEIQKNEIRKRIKFFE